MATMTELVPVKIIPVYSTSGRPMEISGCVIVLGCR